VSPDESPESPTTLFTPSSKHLMIETDMSLAIASCESRLKGIRAYLSVKGIRADLSVKGIRADLSVKGIRDERAHIAGMCVRDGNTGMCVCRWDYRDGVGDGNTGMCVWGLEYRDVRLGMCVTRVAVHSHSANSLWLGGMAFGSLAKTNHQTPKHTHC
jgi:hypothetical protein